MKRWLYNDIARSARLTIPPMRMLATVGVPYLFLEALRTKIKSDIGIKLNGSSSDPLQNLQAMLMCAFAATLGVYRVLAYHPYFRPAYRDWLKTTCWDVNHHLPLGPVTFTVTDFVFVALTNFIVFRLHTDIPTFAPAAIFLAVYFILISISLLRENPRAYGYTILFGVAAMIPFATEPLIACVIALPTYGVSCLGLRRSLAQLPRNEPSAIAKFTATLSKGSRIERAQQQYSAVGWPFGNLCPRRIPVELPIGDAIWISALAGWVHFNLLTLIMNSAAGKTSHNDDLMLFAVLGLFVSSAVAFVRYLNYRGRCHPPLSFFGRLLTGRWIIPNYDIALVAPLAGTITAWVLGTWLFDGLRVPANVSFPVAVTASLLVALLPGPNVNDWVLTSNCRLVRMKPHPQRD